MEISDYEMPEPQPLTEEGQALRDAVEESWRKSEHDGKVAHIRQDDAEAAAALLRWEHPDTDFNVYLCHFGHHWHVGRNRTAEERQERKAEALKEVSMKLRMSPTPGGSTLNRIAPPSDVREYIQSYANKRDKAAEDAGIGITFLERSLHGEVRAADWRSENLARAIENRRHWWGTKKDVAAVTAVFEKQEERERQAGMTPFLDDSVSGEPLTPAQIEAVAIYPPQVQVCSRCGNTYPHTAEFFQRTGSKDHHLHTICRNCNREMGKLGRDAAASKKRDEAQQAQTAASVAESGMAPLQDGWIDNAPDLFSKAVEPAPSLNTAMNQGGVEMMAFGEMRTALQLMGEALDRCEAEMGRMAAENLALIAKIQKWEAAWDTLAGLRVRP